MGFFSWNTSDTHRSIPSYYTDVKPFTVYMTTEEMAKRGEYISAGRYEGYGTFAGVDFHELLAEANAHFGKPATREFGIDLCFAPAKRGIDPAEIKHVYLFENKGSIEKLANGEHFDAPTDCQYQGFFYPEGPDAFYDDPAKHETRVSDVEAYEEMAHSIIYHLGEGCLSIHPEGGNRDHKVYTREIVAGNFREYAAMIEGNDEFEFGKDYYSFDEIYPDLLRAMADDKISVALCTDYLNALVFENNICADIDPDGLELAVTLDIERVLKKLGFFAPAPQS